MISELWVVGGGWRDEETRVAAASAPSLIVGISESVEKIDKIRTALRKIHEVVAKMEHVSIIEMGRAGDAPWSAPTIALYKLTTTFTAIAASLTQPLLPTHAIIGGTAAALLKKAQLITPMVAGGKNSETGLSVDIGKVQYGVVMHLCAFWYLCGCQCSMCGC